MNKEQFQALITRYHRGDISVEELKKLINYYQSFQEGTAWYGELGSESELKDKMLSSILESIDSEHNLIRKVPFYKTGLFKYAVAASLALILCFSVFQYERSDNDLVETKAEQKIEIGSSKATLTLDDGTEVYIEETSVYHNASAESNGKELIYEHGTDKDAKINYNFLTVPRGGQFAVALSDGTKVWLNSDSKIKYPESFVEGQVRAVELIYGEAYFEVSPSSQNNGSRFKVITNEQEIEVLGTEFNVHAYADEPTIKTTLVEGSIQLVTNQDKPIYLEPDEQATFNKESNKVAIRPVETYHEIAWRKGLFSFKDKPLRGIMNVLSRWYDVDILISDSEIENLKFTGQLSKDQDIENILKLFQATNFIKDYDLKSDVISIN